MLSVAIVPVGLTQFSHLYTGKSMDRETARGAPATSSIGGPSARATSAEHSWVYGSDELYLLAERPLPDAEYYGDFPQIENGVGAVASLRSRVQEGLDVAAAPRRTAHRRRDRRVDGAR